MGRVDFEEETVILRILQQSNLIMAHSNQRPKVILLDIGGVCVKSPLQAIHDFEEENKIPHGWINYCIDQSKPYGYWHQLERGQHELNKNWFSGWEKELGNPILWNIFWMKRSSKQPPPTPRINPEKLFWSIIDAAHTPDPWMFPALESLKASQRFILIAISNTVILPPPHEKTYNEKSAKLRSFFDIFISSAEIGTRKPDPKIYTHAIELANSFAKKNSQTSRARELSWENGIHPNEVLYLDDIGENLKAGKQAGFSTIMVKPGKSWEAVEELELATGLKLAGNHPKDTSSSQDKIGSSKL
ncbi:putative epoxide hydrolase [Golovinomyces cichoracearum]|uniref:Putative epoxide hydrolase n=1 Tax=Golovinomyces cichoracearum TaxID=62708 RepID=A0A420J9K9_9PEZI|nr:putative epoxide hydrolase [Golovinomyces cichoracearum]